MAMFKAALPRNLQKVSLEQVHAGLGSACGDPDETGVACSGCVYHSGRKACDAMRRRYSAACRIAVRNYLAVVRFVFGSKIRRRPFWCHIGQ